jgi:hypothetical protein
MDKKLFDAIDKDMPKFNPILADGLAVSQIPMSEAYIDKIFTSIATGFPEGLVYDGYKRCTPHEEYIEVTNKRGTKRFCEIARNDVYLVKYMFSFHGKPLYPRYIYLPFVNDSGIFHIRGSVFQLSPILSDRILSVEFDNIFIVLNCAKLKFERTIQYYQTADKTETINVIWAPVHNECRKKATKKDKNKPIVEAFTTLPHYLFCKYGVRDTFRIYAGTDIVIGQDEINETTYKPDKWVICSSTGMKPSKLKDKYYVPSPLRMAIPKNKYNNFTQTLIAGFFYVVDLFPERFNVEYFNTPEETILWKIILGHLIFPIGNSEGDLLNKIEEHFNSLSEYLDETDKINLIEDGIQVDDLFQLFAHVIQTMPDRLINVGNSVSSLYDKQLKVLQYFLYDIRSSIANLRYALRKAQSKRPLTWDDINKIMNRELPREMIMKVNRNHGEVSSVNVPGDCKIFKITSNIEMQTKSGAKKKSRNKGTVNDPTKRLHSSLAEVASFINLPQSDPTGRTRLNLHIQLEPDGTVIRNPMFKELLDSVQAKIDR